MLLCVYPLDEPLEILGGVFYVADSELHFDGAPTGSVVDDDIHLADVVPVMEDAGPDMLGIDSQVPYYEALEEKPETVEVSRQARKGCRARDRSRGDQAGWFSTTMRRSRAAR